MQSFLSKIRCGISAAMYRSELRHLEPFDVKRIAADVGTPITDLYSLEAVGPSATGLLTRRLQSLGLSATVLAKEGPAVLRDLERVCSFCNSKSRCGRDLDIAEPGKRQASFCPNSLTLQALRPHKAGA